MGTFEFDDIESWGPRLTAAMSDVVPGTAIECVRKAAPEYLEDALDLIFESCDKNEVIRAATDWMREQDVIAFHGSRLSSSEVASIRSQGIVALDPFERARKLRNLLSTHEGWAVAESKFHAAVRDFADGAFGCRQGQAHLTISRGALLSSFNHYLVEGSEFDQAVTVHLLGEKAISFLKKDKNPVLIRVRIPGQRALEVERWRREGEMPGLVRQALRFWAYWQFDATLDPATQRVDFGLIFFETIPTNWIESIYPIDEASLLATYRR